MWCCFHEVSCLILDLITKWVQAQTYYSNQCLIVTSQVLGVWKWGLFQDDEDLKLRFIRVLTRKQTPYEQVTLYHMVAWETGLSHCETTDISQCLGEFSSLAYNQTNALLAVHSKGRKRGRYTPPSSCHVAQSPNTSNTNKKREPDLKQRIMNKLQRQFNRSRPDDGCQRRKAAVRRRVE